MTSNPPQYSIIWNAGPAGTHLITAQATATGSGFVGTASPVFVTVPTQVGSLVVDQTLSVDGVGTTTSPTFSTAATDELLLAFVGADGPVSSQSQVVSVSGAGLNWTLVARANTQAGDAEIWSASAHSPLTNAAVTSAENASGFHQSLTVLTLHGSSGVAGVGAHATASAPQGASSVSVTTTGNGSWVLGVGSDWDGGLARSLPLNQRLLHQWFDPPIGTFWVQATTGFTPSSNTLVTLNDSAPTNDRWNFSAVEVLAAGAPPPPPDTMPPMVSIVNPASGQTVSGSVTVTASATDNVALSVTNPVTFSLDGTTNLTPVMANGSQFSTAWDTTRAANGSHSISAVATDTSNNQSTATSSGVVVSNPPPTMGCFVVDVSVSQHGHGGSVTSPAFKTALPGERLLAFVASDGPISSSQTASVSGAGLSWTLVKRANVQSGTAEIWTANAPVALTNATVTAKQARTAFDMSLYVIAVQGTSGIGAFAAANAKSGAPNVTLTTTKAGSLLYAVGNDWDAAVARVPGTNQKLDDQWLDTNTGDTFWVQNQTYPPLIPAGSPVILNDTAPTADRWNFVGVEILGE